MNHSDVSRSITMRARVRFAKGHLSGHGDWSGTVVGYSDLYDTVHVYVDAPGNSESGSKITYSRADVELIDPVASRETMIRVHGVERVIRTERTGKVKTAKQLEAAHTKAVRSAVVEMRRENADNLATAADAIGKRPWSPARDHEVKRLRGLSRTAERGTLPSYGTYDVGTMRKPFPKVRFIEEVPAYLVEMAPGEYGTPDVARELATT